MFSFWFHQLQLASVKLDCKDETWVPEHSCPLPGDDADQVSLFWRTAQRFIPPPSHWCPAFSLALVFKKHFSKTSGYDTTWILMRSQQLKERVFTKKCEITYRSGEWSRTWRWPQNITWSYERGCRVWNYSVTNLQGAKFSTLTPEIDPLLSLVVLLMIPLPGSRALNRQLAAELAEVTSAASLWWEHRKSMVFGFVWPHQAICTMIMPR